MRLASYLTLLRTAEQRLGDSYRFVADGHAEEPDVVATCRQFATQADHHVSTLDPVTSRYLKLPSDEPLSAASSISPGPSWDRPRRLPATPSCPLWSPTANPTSPASSPGSPPGSRP